MTKAPTQIRIDAGTKREAMQLFSKLGLDLSGAVNLFLRQCIMRGGLPFSVEVPRYNQSVLEAMAEAKAISGNPDIAGYTSMEELKDALESDV